MRRRLLADSLTLGVFVLGAAVLLAGLVVAVLR